MRPNVRISIIKQIIDKKLELLNVTNNDISLKISSINS